MANRFALNGPQYTRAMVWNAVLDFSTALHFLGGFVPFPGRLLYMSAYSFIVCIKRRPAGVIYLLDVMKKWWYCFIKIIHNVNVK